MEELRISVQNIIDFGEHRKSCECQNCRNVRDFREMLEDTKWILKVRE